MVIALDSGLSGALAGDIVFSDNTSSTSKYDNNVPVLIKN